jgi:hypothetical protein
MSPSTSSADVHVVAHISQRCQSNAVKLSQIIKETLISVSIVSIYGFTSDILLKNNFLFLCKYVVVVAVCDKDD